MNPLAARIGEPGGWPPPPAQAEHAYRRDEVTMHGQPVNDWHPVHSHLIHDHWPTFEKNAMADHTGRASPSGQWPSEAH